jgi:hypothetical protein
VIPDRTERSRFPHLVSAAHWPTAIRCLTLAPVLLIAMTFLIWKEG